MLQNLKNKVIGGVKWTSIGTFSRSLLQLLQLAILSRFLPKEAFGLVAMALFVINFTNIFLDMGFTSALLHRQNATNKEYTTVFWFNLVISLFLYMVIILLTPLLSNFYNEKELLIIIPILSLNIIFLALGKIHRTLLQKNFRFKEINIIECTANLLGLIIAIILAVLGYGLYSLIYSTLLSSLFASILFFIYNSSLFKINLYFNFKELKPYFKVGGYSFGSQIISFFSTDIDILIIGRVLGLEPLGIYSLCKQLILKLYAVINSIFTAILSPTFSSIQNDKIRIKDYYLKSVYFISLLNIPVYALVAVLSKEILGILYGQKYVDGYFILTCLAVTYCVNSISNPVGSLHIATGRTDIGLRWAIISVVVTPIVIFFASTNINTVALARAVLSVTMVLIPLWYIQLRPLINIKLVEYVHVIYKPLLFFLIFVPILLILSNNVFVSDHLILRVVYKFFLLSFFFVIYLYLFERKILKHFKSLVTETIKG